MQLGRLCLQSHSWFSVSLEGELWRSAQLAVRGLLVTVEVLVTPVLFSVVYLPCSLGGKQAFMQSRSSDKNQKTTSVHCHLCAGFCAGHFIGILSFNAQPAKAAAVIPLQR